MHMNWPVLTIFTVGTIAVTVSEGAGPSTGRVSPVAPSVERAAPILQLAAVHAMDRDETALPPWRSPGERVQAGGRNDDSNPLVHGTVAASRGDVEATVTVRTAQPRCDGTTAPGSADHCG